MKKVLEASAAFGFSVIVTAAAMAVLVPGHPRLDAATDSRDALVAPAVLTLDSQQRSGSEGVADDPSGPATGCPYLDSREAQRSCPAMPEVKTDAACPFLDEQREKMDRGKESASPVLGQHT